MALPVVMVVFAATIDFARVFYTSMALMDAARAGAQYGAVNSAFATDIAGMQAAQAIHGVVGGLFIAVMLAHIYIGTIGMEGAFEAMGTGEVDVNWAKQHHSLWLAQEQARTGPNQSQSQAQARAAATPAE